MIEFNTPTSSLSFGPGTEKLSGMSMFLSGRRIYWNPTFVEYKLNDQQWILVSEKDFYLLPAEEFEEVISFLLDSETLFLDHYQTLSMVTYLFDLKVLLRDKPYVEYFLPHFKGELRVFDEDPRFSILSENQGIQKFVIEFKKELEAFLEVYLVFVDDLLDPRLIKFAEQCQLRQLEWMPVLVNPERTLVGPLFDFGKNQDIELAYFRQTLLRNRPLVDLIHYQNEIIISPPIRNSIKLSERTNQKIRIWIKGLVETKPFNQVYELDLSSHQEYIHNFQVGGLSESKESSFLWSGDSSNRERIVSYIGGYRTCQSEDVLTRVQKSVSTLTGPIQLVHCLNPDMEGLKVYCAQYPKTPLQAEVISKNELFQMSLGKGMTSEQSQISAIAEATERYNSLYDGTEPIVFGRKDQLPYRAIAPGQLKVYSEQQGQTFVEHPDCPLAIHRFSEDTALHWTPAKTLSSGEIVYVPFSACFANTPFDDENYIRFNSNGCASGNTFDEAILQGLLEVIERDAVAIWWYNKIQRPFFDLSDWKDLDWTIIQQSIGLEWEYWTLDLTHDLGVPVVAAIAQHRLTGKFRFGFGAHLDVSIAIKRALTELHQLVITHPDHEQAFFDPDQLGDISFLFPIEGEIGSIKQYPVSTFEYIDECVMYCLAVLRKCDLEAFVVNTTRKSSPFHTVKVMAPGLCFIWAELGNKRLYQVPVKLGWLEQPIEESKMNPINLFV